MNKKHFGSERRKYPRLKIPLLIFYRLKTDDPFVTNKTFSWNIGGGGLMFERKDPLPTGRMLYLEIYQPSIKYKDLIFVVSAQAKVIWVNKKEEVGIKIEGNKYQIGVKFVKIEKEDKNRIIEYAERAEKGW